jgi:hypothetical protein
LIELGDAGDVPEERRHERDLVLAGELRKDRDEILEIAVPGIGRSLEAREEDPDTSSLRPRDDIGKVLLHLARRETAEAVVRTEGEDQDVDLTALEDPVEPSHSPGAGVSRDPGVHHFVRIALVVEKSLEDGGVGLVEPDPESRGQAVSERDDLRQGASIGRRSAHRGGFLLFDPVAAQSNQK